jgi:hypothetical protein
MKSPIFISSFCYIFILLDISETTTEHETELIWSSSSKVDINWLQEQCENYTAALISSGGTPAMTPLELARTLHQTLQSKKTDNELQEILFDLLGPNSIHFIQLLLKNRMKLIKLNWNFSHHVWNITNQIPHSKIMKSFIH